MVPSGSTDGESIDTLKPSDVVAGSGLIEITGAEGRPFTVKLI